MSTHTFYHIFLLASSGIFWIATEWGFLWGGLITVFNGLRRIRVEGDMEAGVGIEPAYTALQAAA